MAEGISTERSRGHYKIKQVLKIFEFSLIQANDKVTLVFMGYMNPFESMEFRF